MTRPVRIAVVGAGRCSPEAASIAERVGREIAQRGGVLVCGGLGGVMEAAARGAHEAGGFTVGILPGLRAGDANEFIDLPIPTGMAEARNVVNVRTGDAVVALPGSHGTLSEIAHAIKMGLPVVAVSSWESVKGVIAADTPEEAVERAFALVRRPR